jgi:hypothetical protein
MKIGSGVDLIKLLSLKKSNSASSLKLGGCLLKNRNYYLFSLLIIIPPARKENSIITVKKMVIVPDIISMAGPFCIFILFQA